LDGPLEDASVPLDVGADSSDAVVPPDVARDSSSDTAPDAALDSTADADASLDANGNDGDSDAPSGDAIPEAPATVSIGGFAIGRYSTCAILQDATVACWGQDGDGELGDGIVDAAAMRPTPMSVPNVDHVTQLVAGQSHYCALDVEGGVACWGEGQPFASQVTLGAPAKLLAAEEYGACAVLADGRTIQCWGLADPNLNAQPNRDISYVTGAEAGVLAITGGAFAACALFDDHSVRCWGSNYEDELGADQADMNAYFQTPLALDAGPGPFGQIASTEHGCLLTSGHRLVCWGNNHENELGPTTPYGFQPHPVDIGIAHVLQVGVGELHTCALFDDSGVSCWGNNDNGQLALGADANSSQSGLIPVPNLGPATGIAVGWDHACAAQVDGGIACWGSNAYEELGTTADAGAKPYGAFRVPL
jgi:alpha-tubulin suppressor-like RCC1 family protein